jgi:DNA polymerase gamma 1
MSNKLSLTPSDVQVYGTITGRTSGMITTLPNSKANQANKIGTTIKNHVHWAPDDMDFVSFDFSGLELVIAAAFNSLEYCNREGLALDPMATKSAELIFLGESSKGTDVHTVVAKQVGIPRNTTKTAEYSTLYGSGLNGLKSTVRPELPDLTEKDLHTKCSDFMQYFKGDKIKYTQYYKDGLFSHFFNWANDLIAEPVPRLPFLGTAITQALRPEAVGKDYRTSRLNWCVQASGGELHDTVLVLVKRKCKAAGFMPQDYRFYGSIHD